MKSGLPLWLRHTVWIVLFSLAVWTAAAWAADAVPSAKITYDTYLARFFQYLKENYTRDAWDLLMRWVNFLILVAVIVKYARAPMLDFLKGKRAETAKTFELIDEKKRVAEEKIKDGRMQLQASHERLKLIQDRIVSEGQRQKEKMIAAAEIESRLLLESARAKVDNQIRDAYQRIRIELVESATEKAISKLPDLMTDQDHERMLGIWLEASER
jgi:F-type H+-transporting ATPase subunit b